MCSIGGETFKFKNYVCKKSGEKIYFCGAASSTEARELFRNLPTILEILNQWKRHKNQLKFFA